MPEDDADVLKHVAVLTIYKILFIYIEVETQRFLDNCYKTQITSYADSSLINTFVCTFLQYLHVLHERSF